MKMRRRDVTTPFGVCAVQFWRTSISMRVSRRDFLKTSVVSVAAASSGPRTLLAQTSTSTPAAGGSGVGLVDTNVHLFEWPFRRLKYARTAALAEKLRRHGVRQAWAGTFEG